MTRIKQTARAKAAATGTLPVYPSTRKGDRVQEANNNSETTSSKRSPSSSSSSSNSNPQVTTAATNTSSKRPRAEDSALPAPDYGLFIGGAEPAAAVSGSSSKSVHTPQPIPSAARGRLDDAVRFLRVRAPNTLHYAKILFYSPPGTDQRSALRCLLQVDSAGRVQVLAIMKVREGGLRYWLNCVHENEGTRTRISEAIPIQISHTDGYSFHVLSSSSSTPTLGYTKSINNIELGTANAFNHLLHTTTKRVERPPMLQH